MRVPTIAGFFSHCGQVSRVELPPRLNRVFPFLACPECHGPLQQGAQELLCGTCNEAYPVKGNKIYFVPCSQVTDSIDSFKERIRQALGPWYYRWAWIISPVFFLPYKSQAAAALGDQPGLTVDLGSGNLRLAPEHICVDFNPYPEVDLVCDIRRLPFLSGSIDAFLSNGVLEHVLDAASVVQSMARCSKPGAKGFHLIPFMFPFHASPNDFTRWTAAGASALFSPFAQVRVENASGPCSYLLAGLTEALAILFSGGNLFLKARIYPLICALLFWFKFFDLACLGRSSFLAMSPLLAVHTRQHSAVGV